MSRALGGSLLVVCLLACSSPSTDAPSGAAASSAGGDGTAGGGDSGGGTSAGGAAIETGGTSSGGGAPGGGTGTGAGGGTSDAGSGGAPACDFSLVASGMFTAAVEATAVTARGDGFLVVGRSDESAFGSSGGSSSTVTPGWTRLTAFSLSADGVEGAPTDATVKSCNTVQGNGPISASGGYFAFAFDDCGFSNQPSPAVGVGAIAGDGSVVVGVTLVAHDPQSSVAIMPGPGGGARVAWIDSYASATWTDVDGTTTNGGSTFSSVLEVSSGVLADRSDGVFAAIATHATSTTGMGGDALVVADAGATTTKGNTPDFLPQSTETAIKVAGSWVYVASQPVKADAVSIQAYDASAVPTGSPVATDIAHSIQLVLVGQRLVAVGFAADGSFHLASYGTANGALPAAPESAISHFPGKPPFGVAAMSVAATSHRLAIVSGRGFAIFACDG